MVINQRFVNTSTSILLLVYQLTMLFIEGSRDLGRFINIVIPLVALFLIWVIKIKNLSYFYMSVGILITIFGTYGNFSGAVLFFMAMYDNKKMLSVCMNISAIALSLLIKMYYMSYFNAHMFAYVIIFMFVLFHMYVRFWSSPVVNTHECDRKGYTREQRETIEMLQLGLKHKDAAEKLNISRSAYSDRVAVLRAKYKVKDDFQLALALVDDKIISINTPTTVEKVKNEITKVI